MAEQQEIFLEFASKLPEAKVSEWIAAVSAWEKDRSLPDPYYRQLKGECYTLQCTVMESDTSFRYQ